MLSKSKILFPLMLGLLLTGCDLQFVNNEPGSSETENSQDDGQTGADNSNDDDGNDKSQPEDTAESVDWQCEPAQLMNIAVENFAVSVAAAPTDCVNDLFSLTGSDAAAVFAEDRMLSVAKLITTMDENREAAILFLRAGYYVQWYQRDDVGDYSPDLGTQVKAALNTLLTDEQLNEAEPSSELPEAITLIDSAGLNADFLTIVTTMLNDFTAERQTVRNHAVALNNGFTVLFRGHQNDDFSAAVQSDPAILASLERFITDHQYLLGTDQMYLLTNAISEYGRFLQYDTLKARLRGNLKIWLSEWDIDGDTAPLWLAAAEQAEYYEPERCAEYGICDFKDDLEASVLSVSETCHSVSVSIRAQQLTPQQRSSICADLRNQADRFHDLFATNRQPVEEDNNDALEVVIFNSSDDYKTYASLFFNISTDNGGMYLEGNPAADDNQARFIAYRAEWIDEFTVWNLRHEFTHYLDGRYNVHGDFARSSQFDTVWWTEGMAEYATHLADNDAAWQLAEQSRLNLSTVFTTAYSDGTDQVYRWGYLASRYLMEEQSYDVTTLLYFLRQGRFDEYETSLRDMSTRLNTGFDAWLVEELAERDSDDSSNNDDPAAQNELRRGLPKTMLASPGDNYFYIYLPEGAYDLQFTTRGGEGDLDIQGRAATWPDDSNIDARSSGIGTDADLQVSTPNSGSYYYIRLSTSEGFRNVTLTADYKLD